jgi:hypothetical protein
MSRRSRTISDPVSPALLDALRAQLTGGERLAWAASPEPLAFERKTRGPGTWDGVAILGGGYVTLGSGVAALITGHWLWLAGPVSVFVLSALGYFAASRAKARARSSLAGTVYGLTTRRALIVRTYPVFAVQEFPIHAITDVTLLDPRGDFADLCLRASAADGLRFRGLSEPERARAQLTRVIGDPQAAEREIAASEAYSMAMHQLARPVSH